MENETPPELIRDVNDRIFNLSRTQGSEDAVFVCECGTKGCSERMELFLIEYAAREDQPLLARGHQRVAPAVS